MWRCDIVMEKGNAHTVLVGKPEERRPLEDNRRREDNIKMYLNKNDGRVRASTAT
jgi:hypothetical protein